MAPEGAADKNEMGIAGMPFFAKAIRPLTIAERAWPGIYFPTHGRDPWNVAIPMQP